MHVQDQQFAILFADICDSVPLYELSGDGPALEAIARCLDDLARLARRYKGTVIRSKGDDVLCIFDAPERALDAAEAMIDAHGSGLTTIHIGIHCGSIIRARKDIYGDAVNVAARMLTLAKPGEIVASKDLVNALPSTEQTRLSLLGQRALKGKQELIEVFSMILDEGATTLGWAHGVDTANGVPPETIASALILDLSYQGQSVTLNNGDRFLIGRAERCDLVISDPSVSREHALIHVNTGRATLTDQSSTGSWVIDPNGKHTTLRREGGVLFAYGTIRIGRHPRDTRPATEIGFALRTEI